MPRLTQHTEPVEVPQVVLEPAVEAQLSFALKVYAVAVTQRKEAEAREEKALERVAEVLEQTGEIGCRVDGIPMTWVYPEKSTLDKKKLLAQGVTMAQIEAATTTTKSKEHFRVYLPKEKP